MHAAISIPSYVKSQRLKNWVMDMAKLCKPDNIHWCDGSQAEYDSMCELLVKSGTFIKLNPEKRPGCFLARISRPTGSSSNAATTIPSPRSAGDKEA